MGVELGSTDVTLRCNLVTLSNENGSTIMEDYSAGHISTEEAKELIITLKSELESDNLKLHPGVSYRHLLVWTGGNREIETTPPHDISGKQIETHFPSGDGSQKLNELIEKIQRNFKRSPCK